MDSTNTTEADRRDGSALERGVRPVAYVQRMGSYNGVPAYGCLLTIEAEGRMKLNDPLYDASALNAAIAEIERLRTLLWHWRWTGYSKQRDMETDAELGDWRPNARLTAPDTAQR